MMWEATGGLILVSGALAFALWAFYRAGFSAGREAVRAEMAERRSLRRAETRAMLAVRHQAAPWPGPEPDEQLATTGELRALAERGDLAELDREIAAFMRIFDLARWGRRREHAA